MKNDTIGVDVSKDHLDAHRLADGATRRFANDKGGHKALIKWLAETPLNRVVFEPTGPYHRAVERALGASGVPFVKVNPRQARRFAEAAGKLAKTDRLDAAILARMGALLELQARPARSEILLELKELYVAREALVKDRTAAKNRGKVLTLLLLKRQNAQRLEQIDRQIATVEAAILQIVEADESLADRFAILISIPGVSIITAFALLIAMPELGALEAGQAANLAGLAPIARQSGRWTGRSFIRGGRADVRQALYMPALVAARFNPDMKAKYAHLIETGKPAKVALIAIMRKLVVLANALLKANRTWTPRTAPFEETLASRRRSTARYAWIFLVVKERHGGVQEGRRIQEIGDDVQTRAVEELVEAGEVLDALRLWDVGVVGVDARRGGIGCALGDRRAGFAAGRLGDCRRDKRKCAGDEKGSGEAHDLSSGEFVGRCVARASSE